MAYTYYEPGRVPLYYFPQFYGAPQLYPAYVRPLTPEPVGENQKQRKKQDRWSLPGYAQMAHGYPNAPPPSTGKRVLWKADFMWAQASTLHPDLNPVLAIDTTRVNFDVRLPPEKGIHPGAYTRFWSESALRKPKKHMRLVSEDHPWVFELDFRPLAKQGTPHYVTCGDIWTALNSGLAKAVTDAEWSLLVTTNRPEQSQRRKMAEGIVAKRKYEEGKYLRRVDWLGRHVIFRGLTKSDNFTRDVLLPGREPCPETWLVKFAELGE